MADENSDLVKVTANRAFSSAHTGSREKGERFLYDTKRDPAELVKLGYVDQDEAPAASAAKAK